MFLLKNSESFKADFFLNLYLRIFKYSKLNFCVVALSKCLRICGLMEFLILDFVGHSTNLQFPQPFYFCCFRFGSARRQRKEINLSVVLLCIVFVFFCCHTARILLDIYEFINMDRFIECKPWHPNYFWKVLLYVSRFAMILNSSLNFFVYCLIGHTFRRELCRTLGLKVS